MRKNLPYLAFVVFLLCFDQATKWLVARQIPLFSSRTVIPGFFNITHIRNKGAIFGFFSHTGSRFVFLALIVASLVALALVVFYFIRTPAAERAMKLALSLILAGALGNQIDRVGRGYVIDFLDFFVRNRHWPFFNVADSCITIGAILLLIMFLVRKPACSQSSSESAR
ncbi:MAG: signal peptidase II [Candidatus Aminicenantes bacterium RBG_19FT_COMBO_58_17]|jgi:signal peptidase II|nr:MAG: signal peptidase II [Candidatus Aminicenantes bacterium RBG_19FT_COMBO_58_17]